MSRLADGRQKWRLREDEKPPKTIFAQPICFGDVEFTCLGADGIQRLYSQTKNAIAREFTFVNRTVAPEIKGVTQAYLGFISAQEFIGIIRDENGDIIHSIFYDNVRDWQGENAVNMEIGTLTSDHKARFALMNNGVTVIARNLYINWNICFVPLDLIQNLSRRDIMCF